MFWVHFGLVGLYLGSCFFGGGDGVSDGFGPRLKRDFRITFCDLAAKYGFNVFSMDYIDVSELIDYSKEKSRKKKKKVTK